MRFVLLMSALAPAFIWMTYFRERDWFETDAEDVWSAFLIGAIMALVVGGGTYLVTTLVGPFAIDGLHAKSAATAFLAAAIPEEASKLAAVFLLFRRHSAFAQPYSLVMHAVAVSAGFAALENMLYIDAPEWREIAILRSLTAVPSHIFSGVIMGACLVAARYGGRQRLVFWPLAYIVPMVFHGVYDYLVMLEHTIRAENLSHYGDVAIVAYEAFILIVVMEGCIADRCAHGVKRTRLPASIPPSTRPEPSWHWMNWPHVRQWVWGGAGTFTILAGIVVLAAAFLSARAPERETPQYAMVGLGIFALYHGLAFAVQARRTRQ